jgi:hypothetical protein
MMAQRSGKRVPSGKQAIPGVALVAALAFGGVGLMALERAPRGGEPTTSTEPTARNPDRIQAPPRPARTKPIERVVTAAPT